MSLYSFKVNINPADVKQLTQEGYVFAASKSVGSTGSPGTATQWITTPILADNINVSWEENYSLYFTQTQIQNGATIEQDSTSPAYAGTAYIYQNAAFAVDQTTKAPTGSIVITNQEPVEANFGLAQAGSIGGNTENSPLIIVSLYQNGGSCTFTPSETITMGFSRTYTEPGVIAAVETSTVTFTLTAGSSQNWNFNNGKWTQSPIFDVFPVPETKFWKYAITLTATIALSAFKLWLQSKVASSYTITVTQASGATYTVTVQGNLDPTSVIDALKGQVVSSSVTTRHRNYKQMVTTIVEVTQVTNEELSVSESLWNFISTKHL